MNFVGTYKNPEHAYEHLELEDFNRPWTSNDGLISFRKRASNSWSWSTNIKTFIDSDDSLVSLKDFKNATRNLQRQDFPTLNSAMEYIESANLKTTLNPLTKGPRQYKLKDLPIRILNIGSDFSWRVRIWADLEEHQQEILNCTSFKTRKAALVYLFEIGIL